MPKKRKILILFSIIIIIVVAIAWYWQHQRYYPSTDDAYVKANIINMAAQINGRVSHVYVSNNQTVKKGQLLFRIDARPYRIQLAQAKAQLRQTRQNIIAKEDSIRTAQAQVKEQQADLVEAQQEYHRYITLAREGQAPKSQADQVTDKLRSAAAALSAGKSEVQKAEAELGDRNDNNADLQVAKANVHTAELNLKYTHVTAPANGIIANFNLRKGDVVNANQQLFSIVENDLWWVAANYKETQLAHIRPGQHAVISVDIYPDYTFKGIVNSISSGSGSVFSILPPENATGNWVKVTQRFPVKIIITNPNPQHPLRVGASATVTVNASHTGK